MQDGVRERASDGRKPVLMLVEDNPADVRLAREVLRMADFEHELIVARDGEQALAMLRQVGDYADTPRPWLVLLDLNLPRRDGREVLREIKGDPQLHCIPVIVLSTSKADSDVGACYDAQANCYLVKPVDIADFLAMIELIRDFWLRRARLPAQSEPGATGPCIRNT